MSSYGVAVGATGKVVVALRGEWRANASELTLPIRLVRRS